MAKQGSVLYLSYDGLSDHIGQSQVMPYLRACSAQGIKFHLVTFEKAKNKEKIEKIAAMLHSEGLVWHPMQFTEGRGMQNKLYDFLRFVWTALWVSVKHGCVAIHSRCYFASNIALIIKFLTGKKIIFDTRDFWIDSNVEHGRINLKRRSHRAVHSVLRWFERKLYNRSEVIITLTHTARQILQERYPQRRNESFVVIPCCVDLNLFNPQSVSQSALSELKTSLKLNDSVTFGYVGSTGTAYMISELLDCFIIIKQQVPNAKMLFIINNDSEGVQAMANEKGISANDIVIHSAPREQMPLYISLMDYGIFFITPTFAKKGTSPTKQYEMLAMGKAIISNAGVGDAERIFDELDCGYLVHNFNDADYNGAAAWVAQDGGQAHHFNISNYSLAYGTAKYLAVYKNVLSR